jgi:alanine dehydrogenase
MAFDDLLRIGRVPVPPPIQTFGSCGTPRGRPTRPRLLSMLVIDRSTVERLLTLPDCIAAVERAFADTGALTPAISHVDTPTGEFHIKSGGTRKHVAVKANGGFFGNQPPHPRIQGIIYLADATNGTPLALLDSIAITIMRTGAATAVAARHLARKDSDTAFIVGSGTQARIQLEALTHVLPLERAFIYSRNPAKADLVAAELSGALKLDVSPATDLDQARDTDVIVTCTPSRTAFLEPRHVPLGAFIAAIGADSPDKQELDPALLSASNTKLVTDITLQCARVGELHHAPLTPVHAQLGEIIAGKKPGRTHRDEITIFDSTGTAIQDVAAAALVYERALAATAGSRVTL